MAVDPATLDKLLLKWSKKRTPDYDRAQECFVIPTAKEGVTRGAHRSEFFRVGADLLVAILREAVEKGVSPDDVSVGDVLSEALPPEWNLS